MRILFLEDDEDTAAAIRAGLSAQGFDVHHAATAPAALELVDTYVFKAAVLDLTVPGGSGFDVLERIRQTTVGTPVLLLTARDDILDRVEGLERGADDYLVKPFAFVELLARLRALLRRPEQLVEPLRVRGLDIDPLHKRVHLSGRRIDLSRTEFDLLYRLAHRKGEVLSRDHLLEAVWGYRFNPGTNVVDVQVNRLRRKLEAFGVRDVVRTVRGAGYVVD